MPRKSKDENAPVKNGRMSIDDPRLPAALAQRTRGWTDEKVQAWVDEHNERYQVVETCETCDRPLIQEELLAHAIKHVSPQARGAIGTVMNLPEQFQRETLEFLQGQLKGTRKART